MKAVKSLNPKFDGADISGRFTGMFLSEGHLKIFVFGNGILDDAHQKEGVPGLKA